jgi:hypothetical protein
MSTAGQPSIPRRRDDNPSRVPWYGDRVELAGRDQNVGLVSAVNSVAAAAGPA